MIRKIERRIRCEANGTRCKKAAAYGIGLKGVDFLMCEEHFREFIEEGTKLLGFVILTEAEYKEMQLAAEGKLDEIAAEKPEEFFVCKFCGEKFSKKTTSVPDFAAHVRKCKKAHAEAEKED